MIHSLGQHAAVIGGSIAGLITARVLADYFDRVTVIERDQIDDSLRARKSVPQGAHYHAILFGGLQVLSSLYPDFVEKLCQMGGVCYRVGEEVAFYLPGEKSYAGGGVIMREPRYAGFDIYGQSRGLIEQCVRLLTLAQPNIEVKSGSAVRGLLSEDGRVRGLKYERSEGAESLDADLVIDACGRGSRAARWLTEMGFQEPEETVIGVDFAYSSTKFRIPDWYDEPERLHICFAPAPLAPNGGIMGEIEDRTWHISLAGRFGDYPPEDEAGLMAFAEAIYTPKLYNLIKDAERVSEICHYRFPKSILRHYERLTDFPEGFLVLGDAICSFNPVYGQGMSASALQVQALQFLLQQRAEGSKGLDALARDFFPKAADVIATPWALSAGQDLAYPQTAGVRPPDMEQTGNYFSKLSKLASEDPEVCLLMAQVFHLTKPISALMEEPLRSRVLA